MVFELAGPRRPAGGVVATHLCGVPGVEREDLYRDAALSMSSSKWGKESVEDGLGSGGS